MINKRRLVVGVLLLVLLLGSGAGCRTIRQLANLRKVDFRIDRVTDAALAGVALDQFQSVEDVDAWATARIVRTLAEGRAPLAFTLHLNAQNPAGNDTAARLVEMDWTLLIDDTETISGTFNRTILLPPGEPRDIPIDIQLDLFRFFDRSAQDLVELALAVAGVGGEPKEITLRATPIIDTVIGRIRYPQPITITVEEVGGS